MSIDCSIRVCCIDERFNGKDFTLPPNEVWQIQVDYPFEVPYLHKFNTGKEGAGFLRVVKEVGKAYKHVYAYQYKYQNWGHDIEDLTLAGININRKKKTITIDVDS